MPPDALPWVSSSHTGTSRLFCIHHSPCPLPYLVMYSFLHSYLVHGRPVFRVSVFFLLASVLSRFNVIVAHGGLILLSFNHSCAYT